MKSFPSLRDFLSPIWRYSLEDKYQDDPDVRVNRIFLRAIDNQLKSVGLKTLQSKMDLYLKTAREEHLDYFGSWIGLERLNKNESDEHYRKRLVNHVEHARSTIPALRKAISAYLHTNMSKVHIFEPWQYIFETNDVASRTNSKSSLYGYYYRPAIINIIIQKPIVDPGVIDMINWFRPVGVLFLLTYDNSGYEPVWHMGHFHPVWHDSTVESFIGFDEEKVNELNMLDQNDGFGKDPFYVSGHETAPLFKDNKYQNDYQNYDLSELNGTDVLMDSEYNGDQYYSYFGILHDLLKSGSDDTLGDLKLHTDIINPDIYPRLEEEQGMTVNVTHHASMSNMLGHSLDLLNNWDLGSGILYSGDSDRGKNVVRFMSTGATLTDTQGQYINTNPIPEDSDIMPRMLKGQTYYVGFDVKAYRPGTYKDTYTENVRFDVRVDKDQTVMLSGYASSDGWTHLSNTFTYDGSKLAPITFTYAKSDEPYEVKFAAPMLSMTRTRWSPSYSDLNKPSINPNSEYIYAFINVWAFYFNHIESQEDVYNKLQPKYGVAPSPKAINEYISKHFNRKYLTLTYKPMVSNQIGTRLWIMNFDLDTSINYDSHSKVLGGTKDSYNLKLTHIAPLINHHGLMIVGLQLPAFHNDYKVKLYNLNMYFDQYLPDSNGIKFYKPYPNMELWWDITTDRNWNLWGDEDNEAFKYDNYSRAQRHYPVRYIRNYIRNVSYGGDSDDRFIVNESLLNGNKILDGSTKAVPYYLFDWIKRPVLPSLDKNGNPVKSVSILGASTGDKYPANILNNLLKNSVFGYFTSPVWKHSKVEPELDGNGRLKNKSSVFMLKDINSDHVWFNNTGAKLWTSTDSIGTRNNYLLSFSAKAKGKDKELFKVRIKLHVNAYVKNLDKYIVITPTRKQYNITFNTYGIYPNYVTFVWKYIGKFTPKPELFKHLKKYHNTFKEFQEKQITFTDLLNFVVDADKSDSGVNFLKDSGSTTLTSKRRPDMVYMPDEPAYVFWDKNSESKVPKPTKGNKDIDDGWNFNGNLPSQYVPALIPKPQYIGNDTLTSDQLMPGYIPVSNLSNSNPFNHNKPISAHKSYVPDGNGDLAFGYNLSDKPLDDYKPVTVEYPTDDYVTCDVPKEDVYCTATNADSADIEFNGIACHLLPKVYVDGKLTHHLPPQINYEGQDTLAYNDIQFGPPINENELGETFGDLSRYANDFTELKKYGWTFGYLLNHILLSDNITWQTLKDKGTTWQQLMDGQYVWNPSINTNAILDYAKVHPNADPTTFADLAKSNVETFADLKKAPISFAKARAMKLTFDQLRTSFLTETGLHKGIIDPTWKQADEDDWLLEDGEPFDHSEHCVTIDLGRIYENISSLLVHHGSGSINGVTYDSCLQTSIDGKHWHTWYDNYKGTRSNEQLDKPYVEPKTNPVSVPLPVYDCFNNRINWNKYMAHNYYYVSHDEQHYPVQSLSSFFFNDTRHLIPIYSQSYQSTNAILSYYLHSLNDMLKDKLTTYPTTASKHYETGKNDPINLVDNTMESRLQQEQSNLDTSEPDYFSPVPNLPSPEDHDIPTQARKPLRAMLFSANKPLSNNTKLLEPIVKHSTYPFILNDKDSLLNGLAVLQNGKAYPTVHHYDRKHNGNKHGSIPNPEYSPYMYNSKLLKFNIANVITKQYPNLINNLKEYGVKDIPYFTDNLFANCSTLDLMLKGQITGKWTVSVWDYQKQSWQRTQINTTNNTTMVSLKNFVHLLKDGTIYFLIMAYVPKYQNNPTMNLQKVDFRTVLNMDKVNDYNGGLYPHLNLLYNDDTTYHASANGKNDVIRMPWIDKEVLGHKMTLSFNMVSDTNFGKFQLAINGLKQPYQFIEKGYQNFTFTFDMPKHVKGRHLVPTITLPGNVADIYVTGVKAEIGIKQSGYTYPISVI